MDKYDKIYTAMSKELDNIITFSSMCMLEALQEKEDINSKKRLAITSTIDALKDTITKVEQELEDYDNNQS